MLRKMIAVTAAATLLAACSSEPTIQTGEDAEVIGENLHRVDNSRAAGAWIDPNADFSRYTRVLVRPLGVDNIEIVEPSSSVSTRRSNWELTDSDKQMLQDMFKSAVEQQLQEKGSFPLAQEPGDDVLEIGAMITALAPSAARDDNRSRPTGRSRVYTDGAGAVAVAVAFGDSETGEILALVKDSRSSNSHWGINNSVTNRADVQRMFNSWAVQLNSTLENVTGRSK
jgi:Protein of unknown function (DUF3313)